MRPVNKNKYTPSSYIFRPYGNAKDDLILAIGAYCSFCERPGYFSALDVEHVRDKKTHPKRKYSWRNFLLSCKNCNSIKSTKSILNMFFPTVHNTYRIFTYDSSGKIHINSTHITTNTDNTKAQNLIDLIGLDRRPGHQLYSPKDKRWSERQDVYKLATKYLPEYQAGNITLSILIDLALAKGFWSVWMTVYANEPIVVADLISKFPGTA